MTLLSVENLRKHYPITEGVLRSEVGRVHAVDGVSFELERGETLGVVGESGCGKSTLATTLLHLEAPTGGRVLFDGEDVSTLDGAARKRFRRRAQMVYQDPQSSLDPRMTVGESVAEPLVIHGVRDRERRRRVVEDLFERVGLAAADVDDYPHEFSGGQKQRIALARALVVNPALVVADEPTSALDVSVQADILRLLETVQSAFDLGLLFISHDLGVVREVADRVAVMYLGEFVELAPTEQLFEDPKHPYTEALLASMPIPDPRRRDGRAPVSGDVPSPSDPPPGCRFHTRCPAVIPPDEYEMERSAWRGVMDLRVRLRRGGVDRAAVREFAAARSDAETPATADAGMRAAIRAEFDIPARLSDSAAEAELSAALDALVDGDEAAARDRLEAAFPTVCEREAPTHRDLGSERRVACHLHEETQE